MPEDIKPVRSNKQTTSKAPAKSAGTAPKQGQKKDNKTLKIVLIVVGVFVGLGLIGIVLSLLFFSALFSQVSDDVQIGEDTVTVKSEEGDTTASYGEGVDLADGFPSDVPIFEPSTLVASSRSDDGYSAVGKTSQSTSEVASYYKDQMVAQGWALQLDSTSSENILLSFEKAGRSTSVIVTANPEEPSDDKTNFIVTVTQQ